MPNAPTSLTPASPTHQADGMNQGAASSWPLAVAAAGAAAVLAALAWQWTDAEPDWLWAIGLTGLAATLLPLWLGRQLRRQSQAAQAQARRLQEQAAQLQSLGRANELLRRAEQVAQLGSFDWNPVTGALHWSDEHYRLWGHAPGSVTPDYAVFRARIHPDDVDALEARLQHALQTGGIYEFTHRVRWPDGTELEVLARGDVTRDATGRAVRMLGTVLDITRRRAAEARLQMHEFVLNTITDPVSVIDEHRVYLLVNQAWTRSTGVSADEVLGRRPGELQARVASPERDAALQRCLAESQTQVVVAELDLPGDGRRWWETTMFPFHDRRSGRRGAALVSRDITARVATEHRLAASVDNLRMTLNATGDAIFASSAVDPDEPLLFVNDRMLQMWGIAPEQAGQLTPARVMDAAMPQFADPAGQAARVAEIIASGTLQEDRVALRDGRVLLRRCMPTQQDGRPVRVWGFRDITVEARAQAGLRAAEAQQRALLAAFPGHIACIDASLRYTYVNARLAELLGATPQAMIGRSLAEAAGHRQVPRLAHRIARALDGEVQQFERRHPASDGRQEVHLLVTLARGVDRATGQVQCYAFGIDISAQKRTEAALLAAKDEAERANQAKSVFLSRMSHELRTPMNSVLGFAELLRDDTRAALAPHQQAQVQDILHSGQRLLALINGLLELTDGDAVAAPAGAAAPPARWPDGTGAPRRAAAVDDTLPPAGPAPMRVLYIDDNPVNTLLMAAMFERLPGLVLQSECQPQRGVDLALADPPALLLIDIQMPGLDGYAVLRLLRAAPATQAVPAIAVSANAMPQDVARGRAAGFDDYLTKPLELQRLRAAMQAVLPGWTPAPATD